MVWRVVFDGVKDDYDDGNDNDYDDGDDDDDNNDYDNDYDNDDGDDYNTEQKPPATVRNLLFFDTFRTVQGMLFK